MSSPLGVSSKGPSGDSTALNCRACICVFECFSDDSTEDAGPEALCSDGCNNQISCSTQQPAKSYELFLTSRNHPCSSSMISLSTSTQIAPDSYDRGAV